MEEISLEPQKVERAFLVGIQEPGMSREDAEDHLAELASLTDTMGVGVAGQQIARVARPTPQLYLGAGKADEIKALADAHEADVIIFDTDLSPSQQRNWEELTGVAVIDRQEVILDIFAGRAQTREARLQVGLARMEYSLPRLRRAWTHLERQRGGAGMRGGPGELQLEVDRRVVMERITRFKRQLAEVRKQRAVQRQARGARPVPTAAIVGYTNAGKSSLLKRLTGADVFIEDKLFATLDTTTRRILLPNNQPLLLTDTVGFIRKLPHGLVEAFKATLEEAALADFLVHVLDISNPKIEEHYRVTNEVLEELGAGDRKTIIVLNKADREHDPYLLAQFRRHNPLTFKTSVATGEGIESLLQAFADHFILPMRRLHLRIPHNRFDLVNLVHREGTVHDQRHEADGVWLDADIPLRHLKDLAPFEPAPPD
ncbi:MAG TPA: GTPase HflX [Candidatus Sumerlaeota bacterium]|nr:MAG: GTPase HflX [candidate division BRC1 bacterium ADurb.BinA292]HOE95579.1 GTPase HflX [Candidatus Sumerlaeota bacterium]HOR28022.1 GTPase HflX [Candidatus Sumerlaeota bacterium]HPK01534.1 GTPase HflX [Candidatus Sumerlaeota bacterium]